MQGDIRLLSVRGVQASTKELVICCPLQAFHTLYHTDENVLLGAPTGSGKTVSAELAMLRVFRHHPGMKTIYIAPLKVRSECYALQQRCLVMVTAR